MPRRKRNQFIVDRVTAAIEEFDTKLEKIAVLVTAEEGKDPENQALSKDWSATVGDGIEEDNAFEE